MHSTLHTFPLTINESHLDAFLHVNNAMYLTIFEQARWDLITNNGYGLEKILATGIGPTILEANIRFLKELRLHDKVIIETKLTAYEKKIGIVQHRILRGEEVCSTAELKIGLFDLNERKLISPTPEWLKAIGVV